jgi:hypothetical protein
MPLRKPKHLKRKEEIAKEVLKYRETKYALLTDKIAKDETKSFWFSLEILTELWKEIEYQKTEIGKDVTGARIYLTSFPDDHPITKYHKRMNVVFVLTEKVGGKHKDFFIEKQPDFPGRPDNKLTKKEQIDGIDHGTPCPPDCSGQDPEWP